MAQIQPSNFHHITLLVFWNSVYAARRVPNLLEAIILILRTFPSVNYSVMFSRFLAINII